MAPLQLKRLCCCRSVCLSRCLLSSLNRSLLCKLTGGAYCRKAIMRPAPTVTTGKPNPIEQYFAMFFFINMSLKRIVPERLNKESVVGAARAVIEIQGFGFFR